MLDGIRELARKKLQHPLHAIAGDRFSLQYDDGSGNIQTLLSEPITEVMVITEVVAFNAVAGVLGDKPALGGAFLYDENVKS
jgi:hypothetical protein